MEFQILQGNYTQNRKSKDLLPKGILVGVYLHHRLKHLRCRIKAKGFQQRVTKPLSE